MGEDRNEENHVRSAKVGGLVSRIDRYCLVITIVAQLIIVGIGTAIFFNIDKHEYSPQQVLMSTIVPIVVIEVVTIAICRILYAQPLDTITRGISSRIAEKPSVIPPNINTVTGPCADETVKALDYINGLNLESVNSDDDIKRKLRTAQFAINTLQSIPVGIVAFDDDFNIVAVNNRAPVHHGRHNDELALDFSESNQSLKEWFNATHNQSITATRAWTRIKSVPSGDESLHIYDVIASYNDATIDAVSLVIVTIDRTAEYAEAQEDIDFVAMAAHELRSPVTAIRGYLEMLISETYDDSTSRQKELLDMLNASSAQLVMYINNVLNTNKFERHTLKLTLRKTNLDSIIRDVKDQLDLRANTVGRSLIWKIPRALPTIAADAGAITEVITNLVDNAVKYSPVEGKITISAKTEGDFVAVSVQDNGIGIAASVADHLFTRFYRSHHSSAAISGSGIGLYISRAIVEAHGGTIGVSSVEGKGSTFTFTIPTYDSVKDHLTTDGQLDLDHSVSEKIVNHAHIRD